MADQDSKLREQVAALPEEPGVYRFFDAEDTIIYVGKAKSLRKRVSSYFMNKSQHERKTRRLVSLIIRLEYTVVTTEFDALLLENNLIKQFQPRYNILLKDDKSYPYIVVTNEAYPRIYTTRKIFKGQGTYFGPYASGRTMGTVLELIKKVYTLRSCNLPLNPINITQSKFKVCLEYHIGNCKGPCENLQPQAEYQQEVDEAIHILKGNLGSAKQYFKELMQGHAERMEFEKAHRAKLRLDSLEDYQNKSIVSNPNWPDVDVVTLLTGEEVCYINYMRIQFGVVNLTMNYEVKRKLDDPDQPDEDIITLAYLQLRETYHSEAKEVLSNLNFTAQWPGINHHIPQIGDKKKLIEMGIRNALYYKKDRLGVKEEKLSEKREDRILAKLQADLRLKEVPDHIECFDNSNIQGTNPVGAMVCFKNGKPSKKDYRHFHIKTVIGPDDFASMDEIVGRRYARLVAEEQPLPKLIIIDGGKGQLSAACDALKRVGVYGKIPIVGIAKRLEEIYYPEDPLPLYIEKKSEGLRLIQQIRDETHRFAITFHRDTRSKNSIKSKLEGIKGIGLNTADKVYKHFKSFKNITPDRLPELEALIGKAKARMLMDNRGDS